MTEILRITAKGAKEKSACYNTKDAAANLPMSGTCPQASCNQSDVQNFLSDCRYYPSAVFVPRLHSPSTVVELLYHSLQS
eukprot:5003832-Pleurochrysis_carterae.AAC.1